MTDFKAKIESYLGNRYIATLTPNLRSDTWDSLHRIQNHVVDITGNGPTQIIVESNRGYGTNEALIILAVAVYTAQVTDLDKFLLMTYREHLASIHNTMYLPSLVLDVTNIKPYIDTYIIKTVTGKIDRAVDKIRGCVDEGWLDKRRDTVINVKRDLEFISLWSMTISPFEKSRRINMCDDALKIIGFAYRQAETICISNTETRNYISQKVEQFKKELKQSPTTSGTRLSSLVEEIAIAQKESEATFETIEKELILKTVKQILDIAPPSK